MVSVSFPQPDLKVDESTKMGTLGGKVSKQ